MDDLECDKDEGYCECPFCGIGYHCHKEEDGADCPQCGEWNGNIHRFFGHLMA